MRSSITAVVDARAPAVRGAAIAAILALSVACASVQPRSDEAVLVFGDSLVSGGSGAIATGLEAAGWDPVVDGRPGWSIERWAGAIAPVVEAARPRVAVVVLGTNDCAPECRDVAGGIDRIMATLTDAGVQRVFWLNVQEQPDYPDNPGRVNLQLASAAREWSRLTLVDLNRSLGGDETVHTEDGVHFNDVGDVALTGLILDTLEAAR